MSPNLGSVWVDSNPRNRSRQHSDSLEALSLGACTDSRRAGGMKLGPPELAVLLAQLSKAGPKQAPPIEDVDAAVQWCVQSYRNIFVQAKL